MTSNSSRHSSSSSSSSFSSRSHSHSHSHSRPTSKFTSNNPASSFSLTSKPPIPLKSSTKLSIPTTYPSDKYEDKDKEKDIIDKDDWHQIHEPEQRRRIQNRIAQRKFREKARSLKDQAARDAQNRRYAGCAYTCPEVGDLPVEYEISRGEGGGNYLDGEGGGGEAGQEGGIGLGEERVGGERVLSGLPWGGLSMRFVVGRGHGYYQYQQTSKGSGSWSGSGTGTGTGTGTVTSLSPTITGLGTPTPVPTGTSDGGAWPALQQQQQQQQQQQRHQQQHPRSATYYGQHASGSSAGSPLAPYGMMMSMGMGFMGSSDMDMDVDYAMAAVTPESGSGSGGHGSSRGVGDDGMDVTYYDSSPYHYGYGSGGGDGGGEAAVG